MRLLPLFVNLLILQVVAASSLIKYEEAYEEKLQKHLKEKRTLEQALKRLDSIQNKKRDIEILRMQYLTFKETYASYLTAKAASDASPEDQKLRFAADTARTQFISAKAEFKKILGLGAWSVFTWNNFFIALGIVVSGFTVRFFFIDGLGLRVYISGAIAIVCFSVALGIFALKKPWNDDDLT
jgi:hypothetical protein